MTRAVAAALFVAAAAVVAGSPHAASQPYHAAAPAAVQVPYNAVVYGQPGALTKADVVRIIELLESIDRNTAPAAAKAVKAGPDKQAVARANCAACHTPAKADKAGGGFILFADDKASALKPLSARERTRVKEAVESGEMPPNRKLTPADKTALTQ